MAVVVDNEKQDTMPTSPQGKNGLYYDVQVDCTSSKTEGLWDYNAWRLNLDYIESNSKCNLVFTSTLSKSDYDKYIQAGVALRRNTYRGKDITEYKNLDENDPMNLYKQIENGTFADIYVGDYIVSDNNDDFGNKIVWLIADLDNYLGMGNTILKSHHATIIPAYKLQNAAMNTDKTTAGGYVGSKMYTNTLQTVLDKYIAPDFKNHILTYNNALSNSMVENHSNMTGNNNGAASNFDWYDRQLDLMSEVNVFGTIAISSSLYDVGIDNQQYAIFKLNPKLIFQDLNGNRYWYWLKTIANNESFANVDARGNVNCYFASYNLFGVRPRFLID